MTRFNLKPQYTFGLLLCSILLSLLLHSPNISTEIHGVHDWRQSQTAWNIRNFVRHDANILNPRISHFNTSTKTNLYRYEFPIMQWSIAMVQKVVGEHIEVIRLFVFLIGAFTIIGFFNLLKAIDLDDISALIGAILLQFSPVFYYYTINPIPDSLALSGAVWYLYFILTYFKTEKIKHLVGASVGLLIATWAKLPFLMFSIVSIVYFIQQIFQQNKRTKTIGIFTGVQFLILIPAFAWYAWVMPTWDNGVMKGIFSNQVPWDETKRILSYHFHTMFPKLLMNYAILIPFFIGIFATIKHKTWWLFSLIGITFLYLGLEFNMINTNHDYYMMPFLPWLYIIVAFGIQRILQLKHQVIKLGIVLGLITATIALTHNKIKPFWGYKHSVMSPDVFIHQEALKNAVPDDELCLIFDDYSHYVFSYTIDKMGYIFYSNGLNEQWMDDLVRNKNATYMYSNNRQIEQDSLVRLHTDSLILEAGNIRVFKLKTPEQLDENEKH